MIATLHSSAGWPCTQTQVMSSKAQAASARCGSPPQGCGKRGGARVIYYHFVSASQIALLLIYAKNEADDLTTEQRKALKRIVENWR